MKKLNNAGITAEQIILVLQILGITIITLLVLQLLWIIIKSAVKKAIQETRDEQRRNNQNSSINQTAYEDTTEENWQ